MLGCGSRHTVALLSTGEVFAWGDRENGVCGVGEVNDHQYLPRLVGSLKGALSVIWFGVVGLDEWLGWSGCGGGGTTQVCGGGALGLLLWGVGWTG